ncbi:hypothetical protein C8R45DRAFT_1159578 [Mycena sanguinolenta]|nr:hypothetical protein C8R45DRAFT_1159578 [Mycena sanguinolenta]
MPLPSSPLLYSSFAAPPHLRPFFLATPCLRPPPFAFSRFQYPASRTLVDKLHELEDKYREKAQERRNKDGANETRRRREGGSLPPYTEYLLLALSILDASACHNRDAATASTRSQVRRRRLGIRGEGRRPPPVSPTKPAPKNEPETDEASGGRATLPTPRRRSCAPAWDVARIDRQRPHLHSRAAHVATQRRAFPSLRNCPQRRAWSVPGNRQHLILKQRVPPAVEEGRLGHSAMELARCLATSKVPTRSLAAPPAQRASDGEEAVPGTLHPHPRIAMRPCRPPTDPYPPPRRTRAYSKKNDVTRAPSRTDPRSRPYSAVSASPPLAQVASVYAFHTSTKPTPPQRSGVLVLIARRRARSRLSRHDASSVLGTRTTAAVDTTTTAGRLVCGEPIKWGDSYVVRTPHARRRLRQSAAHTTPPSATPQPHSLLPATSYTRPRCHPGVLPARPLNPRLIEKGMKTKNNDAIRKQQKKGKEENRRE